MSEPDRSSVDLERPRVAVRHVADLRGDRVRETQVIRSHQTIRHDAETVPPCQCCDGGIQVDRRGPLQHVADPGHVVKSVSDPAQLAGFDEARQGLVNGLTAPEVQEVLGRAHPPSAGVRGHPIHYLAGHTRHWITSLARI